MEGENQLIWVQFAPINQNMLKQEMLHSVLTKFMGHRWFWSTSGSVLHWKPMLCNTTSCPELIMDQIQDSHHESTCVGQDQIHPWQKNIQLLFWVIALLSIFPFQNKSLQRLSCLKMKALKSLWFNFFN